MKKSILALSVVAIAAFSTSELYSQNRNSRSQCCGVYGQSKGHGFRHLSRLQESLDLTEDQVKKIFDIGTEYREKYFENRNNPEEIKALRVEHRKAIEEVLTESQKEKFNNYYARKDKFGKRRYGCARGLDVDVSL